MTRAAIFIVLREAVHRAGGWRFAGARRALLTSACGQGLTYATDEIAAHEIALTVTDDCRCSPGQRRPRIARALDPPPDRGFRFAFNRRGQDRPNGLLRRIERSCKARGGYRRSVRAVRV
jgi:hypothetical protein